MPAFVAAAAAIGAQSTFVSFLISTAIKFVATAVISAVISPKKPKGQEVAGSSLVAQDRTVTVRQPVAPWQWVYGQVRVGGVITFMQIDPNDKALLHFVVTLAGHVCEEIGDIYFNDEIVPLNSFGQGTGKWAGDGATIYVKIQKSLGNEPLTGSPDESQPFPDLVAALGADGGWRSTSRQSGRAKLWVRLKFHKDVFPNGVPNISAVVKGRKVLDPRFGSPSVERWTDNAALCQLDYLRNAIGIGADYATEIDEDYAIAAANSCDEEVLLAAGNTTAVSINEATGVLTLPTGAALPRIGAGIRLAADASPAGSLPGNLLPNTTYYVFHAAGGTIRLAASLADARAGTPIAFGGSPVGSGVYTMTYYSEPRYALNGSFRVSDTPRSVMESMLAASAGKAINVGGKWHLFAGVYSTPTLSLDEGDLAGPIKVQNLVSRRENANGVKGIFTDPNGAWQPTDFPALASATYLAEDEGERVWRDVDYSAFVTSGTQSQRLSKIDLLMIRQGLTVIALFKLNAYRAMPGTTIVLSNTKFGWNSKVFLVVESNFKFTEDGNLGVELSLREISSAVYDWSTSEEQTVDLAPNTDLPNISGDLDIEDLTATSGTSDLLLQGDGTVVPRVRLRWTQPANPFIRFYEIQFATSASPTEWIDAPDVIAPASEGFALPVSDADLVDLRIRAVTTVGNAGAWSYVLGHTVAGKTALPSDVTGATAVQSGGLVVMGCNEVPDADLDAIEVRLQDEGQEDWSDGSPIANILRGQTVTSAALPPGTFNLLFKARDTSGNYSANAQVVQIVVTADGYTTISTNAQGPDWLGTKTNLLRHWTGVLVPDSQSLASALTDAQLWEQFCYNAFSDCYYEAPLIDKEIDATARVYGDIVSVLGPDETGLAAPSLQVDTRLSSGSFGGFMVWSVGSANFRYLKARIHVDTSIGKPVISQFTPTIDALSRTETGTLTVGGSGTGSATFTNQFHNPPALSVSPQGSGDVSASWDSVTETGFTGYFRTGGVASAGTMGYTATGA